MTYEIVVMFAEHFVRYYFIKIRVEIACQKEAFV